MQHVKCNSYVGIELSTALVVATHVGITTEADKRFPVKVIDIYKKYVRKINEDKISFVCNQCGCIEKEEVYVECDYCSNHTLIEKVYIGKDIAGAYCKKCNKPEEYTLTEESLYELLKSNGLGFN